MADRAIELAAKYKKTVESSGSSFDNNDVVKKVKSAFGTQYIFMIHESFE